jgi:hypothetical protein
MKTKRLTTEEEAQRKARNRKRALDLIKLAIFSVGVTCLVIAFFYATMAGDAALDDSGKCQTLEDLLSMI